MGIYIPRIFHVAPYAAHIASTEADEIGGAPLVESFTLDGVEVFHERKRCYLMFFFDFHSHDLRVLTGKSSVCYGWRSSVARRMFSKSDTMVIGPTPPGT